MHCPRLRHFTRLNRDGTIGKCGHMVNAPGFSTYSNLENSKWLNDIEKQMGGGQWPKECVRCRRTEESGAKSVRQASIDRHRLLHPLKNDYLIVGGVLDNICNSACQTCNAGLSTKIGSLQSKNYLRVDNYNSFLNIPQERILEVDVSGGEPTASKNYKELLLNLPPYTKIVRMNTNGSRMIKELETVLDKGIKVIVTLSLDGIGKVHDYIRWPIKWIDYEDTIEKYTDLKNRYKLLDIDTWTTVSCLNIFELPRIFEYTSRRGLNHNWSFLEQPEEVNVRFVNRFTKQAKHLYPDQVAVDIDNTDNLNEFIRKQDTLRGIDHRDYFSLC